MEFNGIVFLQVLFAQENVEVRVLFVRDVDLVAVGFTSGVFAGLISGGSALHFIQV